MNAVVLTAYVLIWPVLVAATLFVITRGAVREWVAARRSGEDLV
ncbi:MULTISPECIES: putative transporter small subunit [Rhodococcus]|uniref:Transporter small subunit n=1 Tax=Rhodococcus parequi TaxID=3137122 RepID=A0ABW9F8W7_9NOCA